MGAFSLIVVINLLNSLLCLRSGLSKMDLVQQFVEVTGASEDEAISTLSRHNYNLDRAVTSYISSPPNNSTSIATTASMTTASSVGSGEHPGRLLVGDDEVDGGGSSALLV